MLRRGKSVVYIEAKGLRTTYLFLIIVLFILIFISLLSLVCCHRLDPIIMNSFLVTFKLNLLAISHSFS